MKNLKVKFILFCLLSLLLNVFFTTAYGAKENEAVFSMNLETPQKTAPIKPLSSKDISNIPSDELVAYIENLSTKALTALEVALHAETLNFEPCGNWSEVGKACIANQNCVQSGLQTNHRVLILQKRWCGPPGGGSYKYRFIWGSCCLFV